MNEMNDPKYRELLARIDCLENALEETRRKAEMALIEQDKEYEKERAYFVGMVEGLKYSIRCNGVSGAEVGECDE